MELRDHPLMSCQGHRSWPPMWAWLAGKEKRHAKGEIGILKGVNWPGRASPTRHPKCFLVMEHEAGLYIGCLLFDDTPFCYQVFYELQKYIGQPIQHIGGLDFSQTL
ncbi:MAG TPA: hypothetical protein VFU31_12770 [Candidatus Binatia bacterium]|nr:hypothetical protein [Candidatus Binatia bacterium]